VPHLTLEYTDNLAFEVQPLLARLHDELVATGAVNLKGIKSRAIRHTEYRIADGDPAYAFVHVNLLIREGRPLEIQQDAARRVMERSGLRARQVQGVRGYADTRLRMPEAPLNSRNRRVSIVVRQLRGPDVPAGLAGTPAEVPSEGAGSPVIPAAGH